ncbi:hypothetical protein ACIA8R_44075 [Nonomuraea sp. NPDC051191]|uniref:hypothetical protein n=1 Tax=Nonomuraea sp. NPDC051191 TaxID=3364372 RepID=UPI0037BB83FC
MDGRNPALARFDALTGRWALQAKVPGLGAARSEFTWLEGGAYLRQHTESGPVPDTAPLEWRRNSPFPATSLIGLDDATGECAMLYADVRGVHRVYRTTLDGGVWRVWRDAPGFNQRFTGEICDGGDLIEGRWEMSEDGLAWCLDFELTYTRDLA